MTENRVVPGISRQKWGQRSGPLLRCGADHRATFPSQSEPWSRVPGRNATVFLPRAGSARAYSLDEKKLKQKIVVSGVSGELESAGDDAKE